MNLAQPIEAQQNVPTPLADPLRSLRTGLIWVNRVVSVISVFVTIFEIWSGNYLTAAVVGGSGLLSGLWLYGVVRLLPDRPTDIIYLRSFRTDTDSTEVRTALERALGDQFRLSGIRDPRRRSLRLLRFVSYLVFAFKYVHPKYMNLEAGNEWKGRLWRSLGDARGVVIDVTDLTEALEAEVRLCVKCVGLPRILFITRHIIDPERWRQFLSLVGGLEGAMGLQTADWDDAEPPTDFERQVRVFAEQLPATPAGFEPAARHLAEQLPDEHFQESNRSLALEIALGLVLGTLIATGVSLLRDASMWGPSVVAGLYFLWAIIIGRQYREFRAFCGSERRLRLARRLVLPIRILTPLALILAFIGLLLPNVAKVREAAARTKAHNNLRQIGYAMHSYHESNGRLPAANAPDPNHPWSSHPVSWRVQLLPHMEEEILYHQYRFDEPWDGPNNKSLIPKMPMLFQCPSTASIAPEGHTHYRVFASPSGTLPSAPFIDGRPSLGLASITDGTANTFLVVEAAEAVPWTRPEFLEFTPDSPSPKLGGRFYGGFVGLLADGSVRFFRTGRNTPPLQGFITANGNEPVTIPE
jgi:Protein of unknown function (DUF1559)